MSEAIPAGSMHLDRIHQPADSGGLFDFDQLKACDIVRRLEESIGSENAF
jgi:hypothetical protein